MPPCAFGAPKCDLCPLQASCDAYAEQDAHLLPLHMKKPPPKPVEVAVCLLTWEGRIVVTRRTQRLLQGLYVFALVEGETDRERVRQSLADSGLACSPGVSLGTARHVFTHRVWEMQLLHCPLVKQPEEGALAALQAGLVSREELLALPLPTAMKAAKEAALELNW